jgi:hypothetical protein
VGIEGSHRGGKILVLCGEGIQLCGYGGRFTAILLSLIPKTVDFIVLGARKIDHERSKRDCGHRERGEHSAKGGAADTHCETDRNRNAMKQTVGLSQDAGHGAL